MNVMHDIKVSFNKLMHSVIEIIEKDILLCMKTHFIAQYVYFIIRG